MHGARYRLLQALSRFSSLAAASSAGILDDLWASSSAMEPPEHPNGGILIGNGYGWTAETCGSFFSRGDGNGGLIGTMAGMATTEVRRLGRLDR